MSAIFEKEKNSQQTGESIVCDIRFISQQTGEGTVYGIRYKHNIFDKSLFPPVKLNDGDLEGILSYLKQTFDKVSVSKGRSKWKVFVEDERLSEEVPIYLGDNGQNTEIKVNGEIGHYLYKNEATLLDTVMRSPVIGEKLKKIFKEKKYDPEKSPQEILEEITPYAIVR
ncbi:MAG: hypothetical protein V1818_04245 [Candidatus Aenigmatarchaeota archaeon]